MQRCVTTARNRARVRTLALLSAATLFWRVAAGANTAPVWPGTASFEHSFNELTELARNDSWAAAEWVRASYLATRLAGAGQAALPYVRGRFARANVPEEAFLAGLFVAVFGTDRDLRFVRRSLEVSRSKQGWLRQMLGDGAALAAAIREGESWKRGLSLLPSLAGIRKLADLCMRSDDALVRRAGLYWGYWVCSPPYWHRVRALADQDPDGLTRRLASYLLTRRAES